MSERSGPMRDPVFTQTTQVGIVGCDLHAAMRKYVDEYGIDPWKMYEFRGKELCEYGRPVKRSWRAATAMVGQLMWELIEPLDDESIFARSLPRGGDVQHIAVATRNFDPPCGGAFVSLDGVIQAPGGPEEDPTGQLQVRRMGRALCR